MPLREAVAILKELEKGRGRSAFVFRSNTRTGHVSDALGQKLLEKLQMWWNDQTYRMLPPIESDRVGGLSDAWDYAKRQGLVNDLHDYIDDSLLYQQNFLDAPDWHKIHLPPSKLKVK